MSGRQMMLPLRHGGLGPRMQSDRSQTLRSQTLRLWSAKSAERNLKGRPAALCQLQAGSGASVRERWRNLLEWYEELCKWDAAANDWPMEVVLQVVDSRKGTLGARQLKTTNGDDLGRTDLLSGDGLQEGGQDDPDVP